MLHFGTSIRLVCAVFSISQRGGRQMADPAYYGTNQPGLWLIFLYLLNILGFTWNHKKVYQIYRELKRNLRIN